MRTRTRVLLWTLSGASLAVGALWLVAWRSPPFYDAPPVRLPVPILTMAQYDSLAQTHPRPYLVKVEGRSAGVLLFGASHTRDPADSQLTMLREAWATFRPTVALVEGRLGFLVPGMMDPVEHFGEMGAAATLARSRGVPIYSWEPPREVEIARMLDSFPPARVALFYVLRPYFSQVRFGRPEDPEGFVDEYRRSRTRYPGLEGTLPSIRAIDSIWSRDFAGLPDWRETSDENGLPGYLADLSARSNGLRDAHLVAVIIDLVCRGERVFAVTGSSHAVKLDGALHAALEPSLAIGPAPVLIPPAPRATWGTSLEANGGRLDDGIGTGGARETARR
jgi:hypothetical protein